MCVEYSGSSVHLDAGLDYLELGTHTHACAREPKH